jgi:hypothetical protein
MTQPFTMLWGVGLVLAGVILFVLTVFAAAQGVFTTPDRRRKSKEDDTRPVRPSARYDYSSAVVASHEGEGKRDDSAFSVSFTP